MKHVWSFILITLIVLMNTAQGQLVESKKKSIENIVLKPVIDFNTLDSMPRLYNNVALSPNGRYVVYVVSNQPTGLQSMIIQETEGLWMKEIILEKKRQIPFFLFSLGSEYLYWMQDDSLFSMQPGNDVVHFVDRVSAYQMPRYSKGKWMAYESKDRKRFLVLYNLVTGTHQDFKSISNYQFEDTGKSLLMETTAVQSDSSVLSSLQYVNLNEDKVFNCWTGDSGQSVGEIHFGTDERQIVFTVQESRSKKTEISIWYYEMSTGKAILKVTNNTPGMPKGFQLSGPVGLSGNGHWIYFGMRKPEEPYKLNPLVTNVDIWTYRDLRLFTEQGQAGGSKPVYLGVVGVASSKVVQISREADHLFPNSIAEAPGDYIVAFNDSLSTVEDIKYSSCLVSLADGSRRLLKSPLSRLYLSFSPSGKWLVYWDRKEKSYFSCDIRTGVTHNLTRKLPADFTDDYPGEVAIGPVASIVAWYGEDETLLLYDRYDMWRIDPFGVKPAINLTNGYGARHHLKLRLVYNNMKQGRSIIYNDSETVILTGFNDLNKSNGFFSKNINIKAEPKLLTIGPYSYYRVESQKPHIYYLNGDMQPIEAGEGSQRCWVVKRQNAAEAPNYFFTRDMKHFKALTDLQPQRKYRWLTAELVTWTMFDGQLSQGVLYKPDDFDPQKKYPVIFNYYEQLSHRLHEFPYPGVTGSNINIPWFVSRGYLVFTPDIHYKVAADKGGRTYGESAYNSVVSAAGYLAKLPYVDGKKMAIQGHSFGGFQTNYLVTHSHVFAAACEMAGESDPVSNYLLIYATGEPVSRLYTAEQGQVRMGATLWERPDLYFKNSAVLSANKTTTPLLIVHNKNDHSVQWQQGVEIYMALRRLGKPSWMLQYDDAGHSIVSDKSAKDYTLRLTAFFDHYLKNASAPAWMTQSMLSKYKGVADLYEPVPGGSCSASCKVCQEVNKKLAKFHGGK